MAPLETWQMVSIKESFLSTSHGKLGCTACHFGNAKAKTKEEAHVDDFVASPSMQPDVYCEGCHAEITNDHNGSLHKNLDGYYKRIEKRLGYDISGDEMIVGEFNKECGKCHASCGQCHVSRPVSVKGGFLDGHTFQREPTMKDNCTACHGSRVGAEFFGENEGMRADVHWIPNVKRCVFCHDGNSMHSSTDGATHRYEDQDMTRCEDCHMDDKEANEYHLTHWKDDGGLSCQVCHSQDYKNCNSCHTGGAGITGSSYMDFKIAKNPIKTDYRNYDVVTVRHIPISRDTYTSWGITDLPNYNVEPTWKYATPHNIQRWTARTDTTGSTACYEKCHNSDYYLTLEDLFEEEVDANKDYVLTRNDN